MFVPLDHVWRVTEEHLALLDDPGISEGVRDFAIDVVCAGLDLGPPEGTLARTFEVLHRLVGRDDPAAGKVLGAMHCAEEQTRVAMLRLAERAVAKPGCCTAEIIRSLIAHGLHVPPAWIHAVVDTASGEQLTREIVYLAYDWLRSDSADAGARELLLDRRSDLRAAYEDLEHTVAATRAPSPSFET